MRFYSLGTRSSLTDEAWLYCLLEICRSSNKILPFSEDHCLVTTKGSVSCGARKRNKTHTLNDESHFQFVWDREGETWREETKDTDEEDRDSLYYWIWWMSHLLQASACLFFRMELVFGIIWDYYIIRFLFWVKHSHLSKGRQPSNWFLKASSRDRSINEVIIVVC